MVIQAHDGRSSHKTKTIRLCACSRRSWCMTLLFRSTCIAFIAFFISRWSQSHAGGKCGNSPRCTFLNERKSTKFALTMTTTITQRCEASLLYNHGGELWGVFDVHGQGHDDCKDCYNVVRQILDARKVGMALCCRSVTSFSDVIGEHCEWSVSPCNTPLWKRNHRFQFLCM